MINQKPVRIALAILVFSATLCINSTAYGLDSEYLSPQNWYQNSNVVSQNISKTSLNNTLEGVFKYYINQYDNIIYTYFSVTESSLAENNKNVQILYKFTNRIDEYYVTVDNSGMREGDSALFRVAQNFYTSADKGEYISAIEINNGCEQNIVEVNISFNGHNYKIAKDIMVEKLSKNELTAKESTTRANTVKTKTTKPNNTTTKAKQTTKTQTTKNKTAGSTKFRYNPEEPAPSVTTEETTSLEITTNQKSSVSSYSVKPKMSSASKTIFATSIAFALLGIIFILSSALKKDNNK